jgi:hypothetical protein
MTNKTTGQGQPGSPASQASVSWTGDTFSGSASGRTGHLEMDWHRSGNSLAVRTLRYMITGDGSRNKANINIVVQGHNGREWKLNSPDDRKQDGSWHAWDTYGTLDLGGSRGINVVVVFIFDLSGADDRVTIRKTYNV